MGLASDRSGLPALPRLELERGDPVADRFRGVAEQSPGRRHTCASLLADAHLNLEASPVAGVVCGERADDARALWLRATGRFWREPGWVAATGCRLVTAHREGYPCLSLSSTSSPPSTD